jgi:acetyl-CoA carboxylase carboxyltransferase component
MEAGGVASDSTPIRVEVPVGTTAVVAPISGTLVSIEVGVGDAVRRGQTLAVLEVMKMEQVIEAEVSGYVRAIAAAPGTVVEEGALLLSVEVADVADAAQEEDAGSDAHGIRPDLAEVLARRAELLDAARPEAVAKRRASGQRTARENLEDLFDGAEYLEYGGFALAAQRQRRSLEELRRISPADGILTAIGPVNRALVGDERSRCAALAYDYTVMAGTQGYYSHLKTDRLLEIAERQRLPIVLFAEGGGGRPGDVDLPPSSGLTVPTFATYARLSGLVPRVGVVSGYCFAGNAALLGTSDVVIATRNANIGMGGPAMIEGGGLGSFRPEEIGPASIQAANGVVDVLVEDEGAAVAAAKKYLSYFQGRLEMWSCADQHALRTAIPENRLRVYDVRRVIDLLADTGSVLELRRGFGVGMITALVRIEGRALGLLANNPSHLSGAIDAEGAEKAARFLKLCDAFELPVLSLCDTPGFMVGPEIEKTAQVRRVSSLFVSGANMDVPFLCVVLRKGYGLGAQAMAAGSFREPIFIVSWPTGEFGPMGLEGAVRLGFRRELAAIEDPAERQALYEKLVAASYARGKAIHTAESLDIDAVIDPSETRQWIVGALGGAGAPERGRRKRRVVDPW